MGRKSAVTDIYHAMTLFQYALVKLKTELGCTSTELAETLGVEGPTFSFWINAKSIPRDEETYLALCAEFPMLNVGNYGKLREDLNEFKSNPNWPTSGLISLFKKLGYTYYKNQGQFEKSLNKREQEHSEKKVSEFKRFLDTMSTTSPQGRSLVEMLFQVIPGNKIPEYEEINYDCIKDKEVFDRVIKKEKAKIETLKNMTSILSSQIFVLTHLRSQYLDMMDSSDSDLKEDMKYEDLKRQMELLQEQEE